METKIVETAKNISTSVNDKVISIFNYTINILKDQSESFLRFLFQQNLIQLGIGLLVATQLSAFTTNVSTNILAPIINSLSTGSQKNLADYTITIFGVTFKVGNVIVGIINLLLMIIVIYFLYQLTKITNFEFINRLLPTEKNKSRISIVAG
jgi:large-conductance mechanosensitive channel